MAVGPVGVEFKAPPDLARPQICQQRASPLHRRILPSSLEYLACLGAIKLLSGPPLAGLGEPWERGVRRDGEAS